MMNYHEQYMQRCLDLAILGLGKTSPNPMVGAVIVHQGQIIGEGFTSPYGGPHAEVNAIQQVIQVFGENKSREMFSASTMYVSLEPCSHFGKTPPCVDLIIEMGFNKVVIACQDPFSKVNGLGIQKLNQAGIELKVGILEEQAKWVNRRFFTKINEFRPYVILKWAQTSDHYFSPIDSSQKWISNKVSKQLVHKWRSEEDAILVGKTTAYSDNPSLTVREWTGRNPKRILIDKNLEISMESNLLDHSAETIIFNAIKTDWTTHLKYIELENFDLYLPQQILYQLYLMDVQSLIVEGGKKTIEQFINSGLWDEARIFTSQVSWKQGITAPELSGTLRSEEMVGSDQLKVFSRI